MSIEVRDGDSGGGVVIGRYQDLYAQADVLDRAGSVVRSRADDVAAVALDPSVAASALLCPVAAAAVGIAVGQTSATLLTVGVALEGSALVLRASVETYAFLDAAQSDVMQMLRQAAAAGFLLTLPGALLVGARAAADPGALVEYLRSRSVVELLVPGLRPLFDNPWLTEATMKALPWLIQGLAGPGAMLLSGGHWPADTYEGAIAGLVTLGQRVGAFQDTGEYAVVPTDERWALTPGSVGDLFAVQDQLYEAGNEAQVQVTSRVVDGVETWVVSIPGTESWSPLRGDNPFDLTTNVTLMNGQHSVLQDLVAQAMRDAGVDPGEPVMLTGHSQGGILCAAMASDPQFRSEFAVQSVVTAGSPIARFDIPADVSVLSLEHDQDVVPMLEGYENPDRPGWTTVQRDLSGTDTAPHAVAAHGVDRYAETGQQVDASQDPALVAWRAENARFFADSDEVTVQRFGFEPEHPQPTVRDALVGRPLTLGGER